MPHPLTPTLPHPYAPPLPHPYAPPLPPPIPHPYPPLYPSARTPAQVLAIPHEDECTLFETAARIERHGCRPLVCEAVQLGTIDQHVDDLAAYEILGTLSESVGAVIPLTDSNQESRRSQIRIGRHASRGSVVIRSLNFHQSSALIARLRLGDNEGEQTDHTEIDRGLPQRVALARSASPSGGGGVAEVWGGGAGGEGGGASPPRSPGASNAVSRLPPIEHLLPRANSAHLQPMLQVILSETKQRVHLVQPVYKSTLEHLLKREALPLARAHQIFSQLVHAVRALHRQGWVHGAVLLPNVILRDHARPPSAALDHLWGCKKMRARVPTAPEPVRVELVGVELAQMAQSAEDADEMAGHTVLNEYIDLTGAEENDANALGNALEMDEAPPEMDEHPPPVDTAAVPTVLPTSATPTHLTMTTHLANGSTYTTTYTTTGLPPFPTTPTPTPPDTTAAPTVTPIGSTTAPETAQAIAAPAAASAGGPPVPTAPHAPIAPIAPPAPPVPPAPPPPPAPPSPPAPPAPPAASRSFTFQQLLTMAWQGYQRYGLVPSLEPHEAHQLDDLREGRTAHGGADVADLGRILFRLILQPYKHAIQAQLQLPQPPHGHVGLLEAPPAESDFSPSLQKLLVAMLGSGHRRISIEQVANSDWVRRPSEETPRPLCSCWDLSAARTDVERGASAPVGSAPAGSAPAGSAPGGSAHGSLVTPSDLRLLRRPLPPLRELSLAGSTAVTDEWLEALACYHSETLRALDLSDCTSLSSTTRPLSAISKLHALEVLKLPREQWAELEIADCISELRNLKSLDCDSLADLEIARQTLRQQCEILNNCHRDVSA